MVLTARLYRAVFGVPFQHRTSESRRRVQNIHNCLGIRTARSQCSSLRLHAKSTPRERRRASTKSSWSTKSPVGSLQSLAQCSQSGSSNYHASRCALRPTPCVHCRDWTRSRPATRGPVGRPASSVCAQPLSSKVHLWCCNAAASGGSLVRSHLDAMGLPPLPLPALSSAAGRLRSACLPSAHLSTARAADP